MDGLRGRIKANGWRQGSILPPELCSKVLKTEEIESPAEPSALIVLTQDCDLLAGNLEVEPYAEVILGTGPVQPSRALDRSNRQILIQIDGVPTTSGPGFLLFRDKHRFRIPRQYLLENKVHDTLALAGSIELRLLLKMVVRRFERPVLSDAFNKRLAQTFDRKKKGYRLLKDNHTLFRELRWCVPEIMEEFSKDKEYDIQTLAAILESDADETEAEEILEEIEELIRKKCPGLNMGKPDSPSRLVIRKPDTITLADYEALLERSEPWDWEWLSRPMGEDAGSEKT